MSASTEKKNRRAAREAGTDKKTVAAQAEAKKQAQSKRRWAAGTVAVIVLIAAVLLLNSSLLYTVPAAVTIAGENYSPAQVSYYYGNAYLSWMNQYGSYASIFGLDTSGGLYGLGAQTCPMLEDGTWRDYFLQSAMNQMTQTKALLDYAAENGISLSEEELAETEEDLAETEDYAKELGYAGADSFLAANYGRGVNLKLARANVLDSALANKVLDQVEDSYVYTADQLEDYYQGLDGAQDVFEYAYYYAAAETVETENEDGETVSEATDETRAAAKALAEAILADYQAAVAADESETPDYTAFFNDAVAANVEDGSAYISSPTVGSSLGVYGDFLKGSRSAGDAEVVPGSGEDSYYTVLFLSRDDNHYPMAQVRHILIKAEASEDGTYTDEAKDAAKARAQELLDQWKAGEATEESFAALAQEYSEDEGSKENGGLYDHVYKNEMVDEFDAFCFAGHKSGDTGIVYGESSSYAGYHVIYYVGEGEQYSDYIARSALTAEDLQAWLTELCEPYQATERYALRFVG